MTAPILPQSAPHRPDSAPVPSRPGRLEERLGRFLFYSFGPRLLRGAQIAPPDELAPFERFAIPRSGGRGELAAIWYPSPGEARGAVLLAHPWLEWGQAYFYRRGRIEALRAAGFHVLTFDLSGFGGSAPPDAFWDRDLEDALGALEARAPGLPLGFWGVSSGGYWGHMLMSRRQPFRAAVFEDVSPHLIEWSWRQAPLGRPFYLIFRTLLSRAYAYLDLRRHAPHLGVRAAAYVGGGRDPGIPAADHRGLAERARAELLLVPPAGHLAAIKLANPEVLALALATLERGMGEGPAAPPEPET
ncbi:MAG TPA: alpha/beta fold hydrolase [Thermoanaerobaculia bacterium]|jgi:pimeloyl-ACP methyl ester carboxylesterase|nr:alpha/beta fold hydrolase [Thermoanaerobaculia bacterium]